MKKWQIWMEGFQIMAEHACAEYLGEYKAETFKEACKKAVHAKGYDGLYDEKNNTVWGCCLYDNEEDARKDFG